MNPDQIQIIEYIKASLQTGKHYFKAKHIGKDLGLSSKVVGTNMVRIARFCKDFTIQKWGRADATTWYIVGI